MQQGMPQVGESDLIDKRRILIADDEPCLARGLVLTLTQAGYLVEYTTDWAGLSSRLGTIDLLLLGTDLPSKNGVAICQELRAAGWRLPIILLYTKAAATDHLCGLERGADDCLVRPFCSRELLARVRAVLRRHSTSAEQQLCFAHFCIDPHRRQVQRRDEAICLTAKEYDLLLFLADNPGKVFSREQLLRRVWDYDYAGDSRTVDVHVHRLRDKLEPDAASPVYLLTARGHGYYFGKWAMRAYQ